MKTRLLASLLLLSAAACNEVERGEYGVVEFVPDDCGAAFCDLDDGLAVDGTTDIYIDGVDGAYVDDLTIRTSAPWIAEVIDEDLGGISPRVTIVGNAPGEVDLLAVDPMGYVVDYVTIEVAAADAVQVDVFGGSVDGPHPAEGVDDLYFVGAGTDIQIDTRAMADGGYLMGNLSYSIVIDADLAFAMPAGEDLEDGKFRLTVPAGEHDLFIATGSATRRLHFSAK